ncbi:hypothetical protein [Ruegeria sp.]|uniref:hypothetical protein n=1 Tax=Ruegeria sp. TaxID=1879320 RepID=UPI003B599C62
MSLLRDMQIEPVKPEYGSLTALAHSLGRANPWVRFGAKLSNVADKVYMTTDHCILYLSRKVADAEIARRRDRSVLGRLMNKMLGANPNFIMLSGAVIAGTLEYLCEPVPEDFDRGQDYRVSFGAAEKVHRKFINKARQEGLIR